MIMTIIIWTMNDDDGRDDDANIGYGHTSYLLRNLKFLHMTDVEKSEVSPHLACV